MVLLYLMTTVIISDQSTLTHLNYFEIRRGITLEGLERLAVGMAREMTKFHLH